VGGIGETSKGERRRERRGRGGGLMEGGRVGKAGGEINGKLRWGRCRGKYTVEVKEVWDEVRGGWVTKRLRIDE